jgi:hypothetical protein
MTDASLDQISTRKATAQKTVSADSATVSGTLDIRPLDDNEFAAEMVRQLPWCTAERVASAAVFVAAELRTGAAGDKIVSDRINAAMAARDLGDAGLLAWLYAAWWRRHGSFAGARASHGRAPWLTSSKLNHDYQQFRYLADQGLVAIEDDLWRAYAEAQRMFETSGEAARVEWSSSMGHRITKLADRYHRTQPAPRQSRALSPRWNRDEIQRSYVEREPHLVIIDDFLTEAALGALRDFCLKSTIWSGNRYANGRLSSLFFSGFNCPLILQIAEEIPLALPEIIGDGRPLRQLWGFKNTQHLPAGTTVHADFAAVNVNLWITPEHANRNPQTGGMVVHNLTAPEDWNFEKYNQRTEDIRRHVDEHCLESIRIPYRQNRAIIFDSDLFHETDDVEFCNDYASHRINVTFLYGDRPSDGVQPASRPGLPGGPSMWRSSALNRTRRR